MLKNGAQTHTRYQHKHNISNQITVVINVKNYGKYTINITYKHLEKNTTSATSDKTAKCHKAKIQAYGVSE